MGNSGFNSNKEGEESSVESISLTQIFEELCPIYKSYGMSYEEFWIQGMYIYDALCKVSPILHAFSKSGTKPLPYPDKPYMSTIKGQISEEEKQKKIENERLVAQLHFEQWAKATAKKFKNKNTE